MGASDAFSWYMERDPALRSTVVVIDWLDRAPDWDVLVERVDRISRLMPSLRQCVVESPFRLTVPRWSYDPAFRPELPPEPGRRSPARHAGRGSWRSRAGRRWPPSTGPARCGRSPWSKGSRAARRRSSSSSTIRCQTASAAMRMLAIVADAQREPADLGEMPPAPPDERPDLPALVTGTVGSMAAQRREPGLARGRSGDPGPDPLRTRPRRPGLRRRRDGPFGLPDSRRRIPPPCHPSCGSGR